jgi:hypothetical protein
VTVEKGGLGAGTVITVRTEMLGKKFTYHMIVSEPEPGRRLVESNIDSPGASNFIFEPLADGRQTRVTISADLVGGDGIAGFIEKLVTTPISRHIFKQELRNLAEYAQSSALVAAV